jgi:glucan phosphorylase
MENQQQAPEWHKDVNWRLLEMSIEEIEDEYLAKLDAQTKELREEEEREAAAREKARKEKKEKEAKKQSK